MAIILILADLHGGTYNIHPHIYLCVKLRILDFFAFQIGTNYNFALANLDPVVQNEQHR